MAAVMTTGVVLPADWLIMNKVAIPAEIAIIATFMKRGPGEYFMKHLVGDCHRQICSQPIRCNDFSSFYHLLVKITDKNFMKLSPGLSAHFRGAFHEAFCQQFSPTNLLSANQMQGFQ